MTSDEFKKQFAYKKTEPVKADPPTPDVRVCGSEPLILIYTPDPNMPGGWKPVMLKPQDHYQRRHVGMGTDARLGATEARQEILDNRSDADYSSMWD